MDGLNALDLNRLTKFVKNSPPPLNECILISGAFVHLLGTLLALKEVLALFQARASACRGLLRPLSSGVARSDYMS